MRARRRGQVRTRVQGGAQGRSRVCPARPERSFPEAGRDEGRARRDGGRRRGAGEGEGDWSRPHRGLDRPRPLPAAGADAMSRRFVLTAAEMRAAEGAAIAAGTPAARLMERAGAAAAEAVWRFAGPLPALVLCGPGNNGGDGYVIARRLAERGMKVRVAALAEPRSEAGRAARGGWQG